MTFFYDYHRRRVKSYVFPSSSAINNDDEDDISQIYEKSKSLTEVSRTGQLVVDYSQFLAAREIQKHWRGYKSRKEFNKLWMAAVTIQRWWRGFWVRKSHFRLIEEELQRRLMQKYDSAATKIQALFRGWQVRHNKHNGTALRKIQICAGEDLLNCVAYKLHYLMRTYAIPGIYSIYNSTCLSHVEKLLASMTYRKHNERVWAAMLDKQAKLEMQRRTFKSAGEYTQVPFSGFNTTGLCTPHCEEYMANTKDIDRRMFKIIEAYDQAQREKDLKKGKYTLAERKRRKRIQKVIEQRKTHSNFCGDVIDSMRRWNIWDGVKITIDKEIFHSPENIEHFLEEAVDISLAHDNCHCKMQNMLETLY